MATKGAGAESGDDVGSAEPRSTRRIDFTGAPHAADLREHIETILAAVDDGDLDRAAVATTGPRWREGLDLEGVPEEIIEEAQGYIDVANDALLSDPADATAARDALVSARRLIAS